MYPNWSFSYIWKASFSSIFNLQSAWSSTRNLAASWQNYTNLRNPDPMKFISFQIRSMNHHLHKYVYKAKLFWTGTNYSWWVRQAMPSGVWVIWKVEIEYNCYEFAYWGTIIVLYSKFQLESNLRRVLIMRVLRVFFNFD